MTKEITTEQLDAFIEANGYGISSENELNAFISNANGEVVAIYWKRDSYIETLDIEDTQEQEDYGIFVQPFRGVLKDALIGSLAIFSVAFLVNWLLTIIG